MRRPSAVLAAVLAAAALASAAGAAANADPRLLVLQRSDVPAGFELDRRQSRYWPNAAIVRGDPQVRKLVADSKRVNGYAATYNRRRAGGLVDTILSFTHLCRTAAGAEVLFDHEDGVQRRLNAERVTRGSRAYRRSSVDVGDGGRLYWSPSGPRVTLVFWRTGRTLATVGTWGRSRSETLSLVRSLQRRIDKTLG